MSRDMLGNARAEALFCAPVSAGDTLTLQSATAAVRSALACCGGVRGCACVVAQEYGDHPDTAAARMTWARAQADMFWGRAAVAS